MLLGCKEDTQQMYLHLIGHDTLVRNNSMKRSSYDFFTLLGIFTSERILHTRLLADPPGNASEFPCAPNWALHWLRYPERTVYLPCLVCDHAIKSPKPWLFSGIWRVRPTSMELNKERIICSSHHSVSTSISSLTLAYPIVPRSVVNFPLRLKGIQESAQPFHHYRYTEYILSSK
jgi:hypothetical protein